MQKPKKQKKTGEKLYSVQIKERNYLAALRIKKIYGTPITESIDKIFLDYEKKDVDVFGIKKAGGK